MGRGEQPVRRGRLLRPVAVARTPEQREADAALTAAIEQTLTAQTRYDDDGDPTTAVGTLFRDGDVPYHRALGLLDYAATRMRAAITEDDDD